MALSKKAKQPKAPLPAGFVGKGSKSGKPECSQAMSTWVRARHAGQQVASAIFATLGKCRAYARQKKLGERLTSGGSLKGQVIAHRLEKGGLELASAKARAAKAAELKIQRARDLTDRANTQASYLQSERAIHMNSQSPTGKTRKGNEKKVAEIAEKFPKQQEHGRRLLERAKAHGGSPRATAEDINRPLPNRAAVLASQARNRGDAKEAQRLEKHTQPSPLISEAQAAAAKVPASRVAGGKVLLHHVWAEYRKGGGKLSLADFKQQLADSPEARLKLQLGRHDMVQTRRPGDIKASGVTSGNATFNHMKAPGYEAWQGDSSKLLPRGKPAGETKGKAAALVASKRKPPETATIGHKPSLKEQAAAKKEREYRQYFEQSKIGRGGMAETTAMRDRDFAKLTDADKKAMRANQLQALIGARLSEARRHKDKKAIQRLEANRVSLAKAKMEPKPSALPLIAKSKPEIPKNKLAVEASKERVKGYVKTSIGGRKPGDAGAQERFRYAGMGKREAFGFKKGEVTREVSKEGKRYKETVPGQVKQGLGIVKSSSMSGYDLIEMKSGLGFGNVRTLERAKEIINSLHRRKVDLTQSESWSNKERTRIRKMIKSMTA